MELNSLPTDCLLHLVELFPVNVQSQLRAVCTLWKKLIEQVWRKVRKINLQHGFANYLCYITFDNSREVTFKNYSGIERFLTSEHFPGVTSLDLYFCHNSRNTGGQLLLSHCLALWTVTLTDLSLKLFPQSSRDFQSATWRQIDSMKSLKSLRLNFTISGIRWKVPETVSIMANLEKFSLFDYENDDFDVLAQLGPKLRHLILRTPKLNNQILTSIVPKLTSLSELLIPIPQFPKPNLLDLLTSLAQHNQLNKLCLSDIDWDQFISLAHKLEHPKLTSVKYLNMTVCNKMNNTRVTLVLMNNFDRVFFATIPSIFPALETIKVELIIQSIKQFQQLVDTFNVKLKQKFVALREGEFSLVNRPDLTFN